jgi:ubiquinone/menaquinone biosynthesis C-methylase UbiE
MQRAAATPELLDGPLEDLPELRGNLRDLRRINRLLGGTTLSRQAVDRLVGANPGRSIRLLDVGTGSADIALALRLTGIDGWPIEAVAVDNRPEIIAAARSLHPTLDTDGGIQLCLADGRELPFADGAFDVAHASLVVHHLEPDEAVAFLAELRRVSRAGVVVNDLIRGWWFWAFAWTGSRLMSRNRLTRHDAPLSVRRAYTVDELRGLVTAAGLRVVHTARGIIGHRVAIAAVPNPP